MGSVLHSLSAGRIWHLDTRRRIHGGVLHAIRC